MTREEQIEQESYRWFLKDFYETNGGENPDQEDVENAFQRGAEWADQHPAWVSVKDSLPEDDECCLIYGDCGIDIGSYNSKTQYWLSEYSGQPTHWMPLPQPPRKEIKK